MSTELQGMAALIPLAVSAAIEVAKQMGLPGRWRPLVGVVLGGALTGLWLGMTGASALMIAFGVLVGAFAPSLVADKVLDPLRGIVAVKYRGPQPPP